MNTMLALKPANDVYPPALQCHPTSHCALSTSNADGLGIPHGDATRSAQALLNEYLQPIIGWFDIGNGTSAADAVAAALAVDLRQSSKGIGGLQRLLSLSRPEIVDLLCEMVDALATPDCKFELPLGAVVTSQEPGAVRIGKEWWVLDADTPGLHPMETTRYDADGRNLALLQREITRLTRNLACRRMGLPQAKHIVDSESRHLLQFPPFAEAGGVALQKFTGASGARRFCSALPSQIRDLAVEFVKDMRLLWKRRKAVAARADQIRAGAEIAIAASPGTALRTIAIDLTGQNEDDRICMYVEYDGTDEALRPGFLLDFVPWDHDPTSEYGRRHGPFLHDWHEDEREALAKRGADGRINDLARAILAAVPADAPALLARLRSELEVTITVPTHDTPCYATLYWKTGVIEGEVTIPGRLATFGDRVEVYGEALPETVLATVAGKRFCDVVASPLAWEASVDEVHEINSGLRFTLEQGEQLIDTAIGRIWPG